MAFAAINDGQVSSASRYPTFMVALVAIIAWMCLEHMPIGRHLYAIGSNRRAAELTGVNGAAAGHGQRSCAAG